MLKVTPGHSLLLTVFSHTGAPSSGKTTVYNHLQILLGRGFSKSDRLKAREWIAKDLIDAFKAAKTELEFIRTDFDSEAIKTEVCRI